MFGVSLWLTACTAFFIISELRSCSLSQPPVIVHVHKMAFSFSSMVSQITLDTVFYILLTYQPLYLYLEIENFD